MFEFRFGARLWLVRTQQQRQQFDAIRMRLQPPPPPAPNAFTNAAAAVAGDGDSGNSADGAACSSTYVLLKMIKAMNLLLLFPLLSRLFRKSNSFFFLFTRRVSKLDSSTKSEMKWTIKKWKQMPTSICEYQKWNGQNLENKTWIQIACKSWSTNSATNESIKRSNKRSTMAALAKKIELILSIFERQMIQHWSRVWPFEMRKSLNPPKCTHTSTQSLIFILISSYQHLLLISSWISWFRSGPYRKGRELISVIKRLFLYLSTVCQTVDYFLSPSPPLSFARSVYLSKNKSTPIVAITKRIIEKKRTSSSRSLP